MQTSLTLDDINRAVRSAEYLRSGETLTLCVLTLRNGYTVTGQSACVDPANFDEAKGRELAHKDALGKVWPLEGYLLREKLVTGVAAHESELSDMAAQLQDAQAELVEVAERLSVATTGLAAKQAEIDALMERLNQVEAALHAAEDQAPSEPPPAPAESTASPGLGFTDVLSAATTPVADAQA